MYPKISITIDLLKIDKSRINEKPYIDKNGHEVPQKLYYLDIVPTKETKVVAEGDTWQRVKAFFVADSQTKEERAQKAQTKYLGSGFVFEDKVKADMDDKAGEDITADQIPF